MIHINLLPVREARRKADTRQHVMQLVLLMILVAAGIGYVHSRVSDQIQMANNRVRQMERDIDQFKPQLDQVAAFRNKKASLEKKIDIIDGLDRARSGPIRVMDELATRTPEKLWLSSIVSKGPALQLAGASLDNELVAVFLRALGDSPYLTNVDLDSTELSGNTTDDGLKLVKFKIQASMVNPKKAGS